MNRPVLINMHAASGAARLLRARLDGSFSKSRVDLNFDKNVCGHKAAGERLW